MSAPAGARLPRSLEAQIRAHGEATYPLECCGAILGHGDGATSPWRITGVTAAPNEHGDDRRRRYLVPPEFQLEVEREARAAKLDVLGYYHSHPDHPAHPSEYDLSHAWVGYLYLICSIKKGRATDLNGFTLERDGGPFLDVALRDDTED